MAVVYACFGLVATLSFQAGDFAIPTTDVTANLFWLFIYLAAFLLYAGLLKLASGPRPGHKIDLTQTVLYTVLFSGLLVIHPPLGAIDVTNYAFAARLSNFLGANPYLTPFIDFSLDPYFDYAFENWRSCPYGPVFTIFTLLIDRLAGQNFFLTADLLRISMVGFLLGSLFLIHRILEIIKPEKANQYTLIMAWNPLVLFEVANNGHNDIMVLFFMLFAIYCLVKEARLWVIPLLLVSVLIKYVTVLTIPFFMLYIYRKDSSISFWGRSLLVCGLLLGLSYYPFLKDGLSIFTGLFLQFSQAEFWFHYGTLPLLAYWMNDLLAIGFEPTGIKHILSLLFILVYASTYRHKIETKTRIYVLIFKIYIAYFLVASFWVMPWYFLWILPLPLFFSNEHWESVILFLTFSGLLSYFVPVGGLMGLILALYWFSHRERGRSTPVQSST